MTDETLGRAMRVSHSFHRMTTVLDRLPNKDGRLTVWLRLLRGLCVTSDPVLASLRDTLFSPRTDVPPTVARLLDALIAHVEHDPAIEALLQVLTDADALEVLAVGLEGFGLGTSAPPIYVAPPNAPPTAGVDEPACRRYADELPDEQRDALRHVGWFILCLAARAPERAAWYGAELQRAHPALFAELVLRLGLLPSAPPAPDPCPAGPAAGPAIPTSGEGA